MKNDESLKENKTTTKIMRYETQTEQNQKLGKC